MGFSLGYWHYFHYSGSRGYLIVCCHGVASSRGHHLHLMAQLYHIVHLPSLAIESIFIIRLSAKFQGLQIFSKSFLGICMNVSII